MFDDVMSRLSAELERLADEARACRERIQALIQKTVELRAELEHPPVEGERPPVEPTGEPLTRKLQSV